MKPDSDYADPAEVKFGQDLRAARERLGISQEQLASQMRAAGYNAYRQNTIYRIESGLRGIRLGEALALSRLTLVPVVSEPHSPVLADAWTVRKTADILAETASALASAAGNMREVSDLLFSPAR